ncbi:MAG: response regulator [Planctomycetota bacterium]|jgi:DNA-binding response OmpR family regulator
MAKVLVVDDDPAILEMLRTMVEEAGDDVVTADTGLGAHETAREERPEIILTDHFLPDISGVELCGRLRREAATANSWVILTTGKWDEQNMLEASKVGVNDFLLRPFRFEVLKGKLDNAREHLAGGTPAPANG